MDEDQTRQLKKKVDILEKARDQISQGWLQTEREKTRLAAAIDSLSLGFMVVDDYNKIIFKNPAVDAILGKSDEGDWTVATIQKYFGDSFDLATACKRCFSQRKPSGPIDLAFGDKSIRIFLSPISLLRESITVFGVSILIEDITGEKQA